MSDGYDVIVIGAGHNGLSCATLLARKGRKVVVLERRETVGGLAAPLEFHPGYRSAGLFHDSSGVRPWAIEALGLGEHGLITRDRPPDLLALGNGNGSLLLAGDPEQAVAEISKHSNADGEAYGRFREFITGLRGVLLDFLDRPPIDLIRVESASPPELLRRGLRLRLLGRERMMELLRIPPTSVADWLGEWFEGDLLKSALALPAIAGGFAGPRSPGTSANLLLHLAAAGPGVVGGGPSLVAALEKAARASGVELRTGSGVREILTDGESATGVLLDSGETIPGPTGSGKTTTLYSALKTIASRELNVTTIEDPIEMVDEELNQTAVQNRAGIGFATALRHILRQDPDVIMVGEIRDAETAQYAVQAALTGHLVFSTLHTNDAAASVTRLADLDVEPYLISSTLVGIVAQRLVRKICPHCSTEHVLSALETKTLRLALPEGRQIKVRIGDGCAECRGTGHLGRTAIFEVLPVDDAIQALILEGADAARIKREATKNGMRSLRQSALRKLSSGATSYQEVVRVTAI